MSKETCSDRKPNASETARRTASVIPDSTDSHGQHKIVDPGKSSGGEIFSPAVTEGPAGDAKNTAPGGRLKIGRGK